MTSFRSRPIVATLAASGIAAFGVLFSSGVASAAPLDQLAEPLLRSDCSFAQVDAALHDQAPELAALIDSYPSQKAELAERFDVPVEQRRAELQRAIQENPEAAQQAQNDPRTQQLAGVLQRVADTCKQY
ncbi:hemophore-related protein [Nocardia asteroides]|uniref:hemophore-related protein n=1 Tax=Nocardia asteroides TaxID=1824 RepID=UPI001E296E83|nr:hemophore-related protein [Nocardia asteroides]UGT59827.1 hemophore-related protein [Nocardia asteroides]